MRGIFIRFFLACVLFCGQVSATQLSLTGAGVNGVANSPTISFTDSATNAVGASVNTFTSKSIGAAASGRLVVVGVSFGVVDPNLTISSVTIGGVTANSVVSASFDDATVNLNNAFYSLVVNSGTTATIVVTLSGATGFECNIVVYALYNLISTTPTATLSKNAVPTSGTMNIPANGVALGYSYEFSSVSNNPQPVTWVGLTRDLTANTLNTTVGHSSASKAFVSAVTPLTISATPNSADGQVLVAAAYH